MPSIVITPEDAAKAKAKLLELMDLEDDKGRSVQAKAAADIVRLFQAQERYFAKPETPEDYERATRYRGSEAERLEAATPEDLLDIQRRLLEGRPGKPTRKEG